MTETKEASSTTRGLAGSVIGNYYITQALALYNELLDGLDVNGNGQVKPIQGEGGIPLVIQHT